MPKENPTQKKIKVIKTKKASKPKTLFRFNLMSQKSKEEIKIINERNETIFYSLVLFFAAVFMFFMLTLLDLIVLESRIDNINNLIIDADETIEDYSDVKTKNGELFVKANTLTPVLEQDIQVKDFIDVATTIVGNSNILSYTRESSGLFVISIQVDDYTQINGIIDKANSTQGVDQVLVRDIVYERGSENKYILVFQFGLAA